ncbi:MAG: glycosyltransferase [Nitrospina sp.]|jgi:hypothetical protein|nr:glycosyltransferase [Nitrospina sp.]MBT5633087.1 glycosyltransferase [Nitrospina sp.]MBT6248405.1 glycosyltransferase [Nitrospina sp.]
MFYEIPAFRLVGLLVALASGYLLLRLVHSRKISGFEFLFWFGAVSFVVTLSIYPQFNQTIFSYFSFTSNERSDRLIGLAFIFIFLLSCIVFYYRNRLFTCEQQFLNTIQVTTANQFIHKHKEQLGESELFILIPALNEEENLKSVLEKIPTEICGLHPQVIVISDGSTDNTVGIAIRKGAEVVEHPINFGGGMALKTGYRIALAMGARYVVTLDADGQYQPNEIERLLHPLIENKADMVSGSRVLGFFEQNLDPSNIFRSVGVRIFNIILTAITGQKITDSSSGFRAIKAEYLPHLTLIQSQFHSSEFLIESLKNGLKFQEVPISFLKRISGESKKPATWAYGIGFLRAMLKTWLRK